MYPSRDRTHASFRSLIGAASPPYLLATKLEAFKSRGREDFIGARDFADMIVLVDGREELVGEVLVLSPELRADVAAELKLVMAHARFLDGVSVALRGDAASQARAQAVGASPIAADGIGHAGVIGRLPHRLLDIHEARRFKRETPHTSLTSYAFGRPSCQRNVYAPAFHRLGA